jgi:hypothetical protein
MNAEIYTDRRPSKSIVTLGNPYHPWKYRLRAKGRNVPICQSFDCWAYDLKHASKVARTRYAKSAWSLEIRDTPLRP